ncbi:MAG: DNA (cytosine-5-)-methyltransferase, partial [Intestinibacter bartlettii]|nr:DNA (cytosine-5-)-methyltransferase [Intestinibacter bartlettii]
MKLLSLFSGIGAFEKALKNANVDYDLVGFSEIDKFAIKSYCAIHGVGENLNLGDVSSIDVKLLPQNIDIVVHGSPCTSFSVAGKGKGGDKGSGTQSSLMWYSVDIIKKVKPKYVVWENVKNVISKKHIHNFNQYIEDLKEIGYTSYYKILNAKDFGLPQNRERIYVVSILDDNHTFEFPQGFPLKLKLKDILEDSVEEKY